MEILWTAGAPTPVAAVAEALGEDGRRLSHSAVKAVLNNLAGKRLLTKSKLGKATLFQPRLARAELNREVVSSVILWLKQTYGTPVISQLVDELTIDEADMAEFERLIGEKRAKGQ